MRLKKVIAFMLFLTIIVVSMPCKKVSAGGTVSAKAYILIDASTGKIILSCNENEKLPIASTTKIMTSLIALEQDNLYEKFKVQEKAIMVEGTSMGLKKDDSVNLIDLTKGMLMSSGNDAANTVAVKVSGSIESFAVLMNKKAKEIGMTNTSFVTPSGLDSSEHYSTAKDMATLARYAINNEDFLNICSKQKTVTEFGNPPKKQYLYNHNRLLKDYEGCIGIKTGFTKKSGRCLVSAATRNGVTLICVTLSAPNDWNDHKILFDYGFKNAKITEFKGEELTLNADVVGGEKDKTAVTTCGSMPVTLNEEEQKNVNQEIVLNKFYYAPIKKDEILGKVVYTYSGIKIGEKYIVASEDVNYKK